MDESTTIFAALDERPAPENQRARAGASLDLD
jgi:hypothetical protein